MLHILQDNVCGGSLKEALDVTSYEASWPTDPLADLSRGETDGGCVVNTAPSCGHSVCYDHMLLPVLY